MARPALLGQTIVVENRRGIRTIGTGRVVRADRRLIGIGSVNHYVVNASVYPLATTR